MNNQLDELSKLRKKVHQLSIEQNRLVEDYISKHDLQKQEDWVFEYVFNTDIDKDNDNDYATFVIKNIWP